MPGTWLAASALAGCIRQRSILNYVAKQRWHWPNAFTTLRHAITAPATRWRRPRPSPRKQQWAGTAAAGRPPSPPTPSDRVAYEYLGTEQEHSFDEVAIDLRYNWTTYQSASLRSCTQGWAIEALSRWRGRVGPHQMPTAFAARSCMQDRKYSVTRQTMLHVYSAGH